MLSTDSGHAASLTSEGTGSVTVVDWEHTPRSPQRRGEDRKLLLERLRERTTSRTNVSPPSEPAVEPSLLISTASSQDESTSRQSSRPLPRTPSPHAETEEEASTITGSSKTVRPSLYDLLNKGPSSSSRAAVRSESSRPSLVDVLRQDLAALSAHQGPGEEREGTTHRPTHSISIDVVPPSPLTITDAARSILEGQSGSASQRRRRTLVAPRRAWDDETVISRPFSERRPRPRPISEYGPTRDGVTDRAHRPSLAELMSQGPPADALRSIEERHRPIRERFDNLRKASSEALARARRRYEEDQALVIPPPPILSQSDIHIGQSPSFVVPPPPILYPSVGLTLPGSDVVPTAMPERESSPTPVLEPQTEVPPPQSPGQTIAPTTADVAVGAEPPACEEPSSDVTQHKECCSVAQGKAEVQTLIGKFMSDLEGTMKKTFGEDWSINDALQGAGHNCGHQHAASLRPQFGTPPPPELSDPLIPCLPPSELSSPTRSPSLLYSPVAPQTPVGQPFFVPPPLPPMPPLPPFPGTEASRSVFAPVVPPPPPSWVPPPSWTSSAPAHPHPGITCDGCRRRNFYGIRYKCMDCYGMSTFSFPGIKLT